MNNTNALIRQLQIDLIIDTPNEILEWFELFWYFLIIIEIDVFHKNGGEFIHYMDIGGEFCPMFYRDDNRKIIYASDNNYSNILKQEFNIYSDVDHNITSNILFNYKLNNTIKYKNVSTLRHYDVLVALSKYTKEQCKTIQ